MVKNLPADARDVGLIPEGVRAPGKENANLLARKIPRTKKLGGLIVIAQSHPSLLYVLLYVSYKLKEGNYS